ncbi:MAG: hypothetical protein RIB84_27785 [Sneathiellaceae bacterium]
MQDRNQRPGAGRNPAAALAAALLAGGMVLGMAMQPAMAADPGPITAVDENSPKTVEFDCAGMKHKIGLELRADVAEDYYIQAAGPEVMIPVTCATATVGLSADKATISCNKQVKGSEPMTTVDGVDLADALAKAIGAASCRRVR